MPTSYVVPQALVYQEFTLLPTAITEPLRACIIGPNYELVTTAAQGALGEYDPNSETCYSWPNRSAGAVVDQDWTRVFIDDALLQYFHNPASTGDEIQATFCNLPDVVGDPQVKNAIRAANTNWVTSGAYARAAALRNRDVTVGDIAKVEAVIGAETVTLWTYVAGFMADEIPGVVGDAVEDPNNESAPLDESSSINPSIVIDKIGFAGNSVDITDAATPPDHPEQGYIDGVQSDEYTLEVIVGGAPADAIIRVTSASGTDDTAELTPNDWGVATPFGNKSLSVTWTRAGADIFVDGMKWELTVNFGAVDVDPVSGGTYSGPSDTTYVIEVTTGGMFGGASTPQVTISTTTGIDSSGPHSVAALDTNVAIGSYGVTIRFTSLIGAGQGLYRGDRYYIPVTAPAAGAIRTLVLGHNLPDDLIGLNDAGVCATVPDLSVTLYIQKDIEVPEDRTGFAPIVNWTTSATEICLADGILSYDSTWVDDDGVMLPLPVKGGDAWVYYRALLQGCCTAVGTISLTSALAAALGTLSVDNPVAYGVYMALLNSNGTDVKYICVPTDDLAGYNAALGKLTQRNDVHGLVPMTFTTAIHDAVAAHCDAMSAAEFGRWRRMWTSTELAEESGIVTADSSGDPVLATITDDPGTSGLQYTLVEITTDVDIITAGVIAGDKVRAQYSTDGFGNVTYSEYTIDAVLSEDSVRLLTGPSSPISVAAKIEIWRDLSDAEMAAAVAAGSAHFSNRRVSNVWPDYFESGTDLVSGFYLAAALAGLRSGTAPQRSLTNVAVAGVDSVERTTEMFTEDELDTMAASGTCIVTESPAGEIYVRHDLTTDMTDLNSREEMISANLDSISYVILAQVAPYIGISNVTEQTMNQLRAEITDAIDYLVNNSNLPTVGGQLISGDIVSIQRHPTLHDRVVIVLDLDLPEPLNNVEVHLVV